MENNMPIIFMKPHLSPGQENPVGLSALFQFHSLSVRLIDEIWNEFSIHMLNMPHLDLFLCELGSTIWNAVYPIKAKMYILVTREIPC